MTEQKPTMRLGTIGAACELIGGDKPIAHSPYWRGGKAGIYPPPIPVGPNTRRVDLDELTAVVRARRGEAA
jgi:hypothetical protein